MTEELKNCPFCGMRPSIEEHGGGFGWCISCENDECGVIIQWNFHINLEDKNYAIKKWNTRAEKK